MIQIISNLDSSLLFDLSKTYGNQKKSINKKLLPAIKSAMNPTMNIYDSEIVKVVKQLHKSRREIWKKQNEGRITQHNKRQHVASRRDQV